MNDETQLFASIAYIVAFILLAYYYKKYPPKKINWLYGYRTRRSMANQAIWEAANAYSAAIFLKWQMYLVALPVVAYFIFPTYTFIISVIAHTLLILMTIPATELYLDKHFDKNGNPL